MPDPSLSVLLTRALLDLPANEINTRVMNHENSGLRRKMHVVLTVTSFPPLSVFHKHSNRGMQVKLHSGKRLLHVLLQAKETTVVMWKNKVSQCLKDGFTLTMEEMTE